ncbi:CaiB/BaiF CoA transferase family protein [Thermodesulfobacteriota bacterium]
MQRVLEDIRVLDFGRFIACPYCGMILADMGAEVIRIDRPGGEEDRTVGLLGPNGENVSYPSYARNKKGVTLNLLGEKADQGKEVLTDLVRESDAVIHNFSPYAAQLMGLDYESLIAIKPDIILTAISCFGSDGPYSHRTGFDFIAQAMSGCMALGGYPDKPPVRAYMNPIDYSTAICAALGTVLALRHRDKTGEGQMVDLALLQTAVSFATPALAEAEVLGRLRPLIGTRVPYVGPSDLFPCKDGWVFIATIMDTLWKRLCRVIGHEELIDDPQLQSDLHRYENREKIDPLIAQWTAERTMNEVMDKMEEARIPCGPYLGLDQVSKDPHVQARRMIEYVDMEVPGLENLPICGMPVKLSRTPGRIERRAPRVGEHNHEIYGELLGFDDQRMDELRSHGVI